MKRPTKDYQDAHQIEQPTMIGQYLKDVEKYMDYQDQIIKSLTTPNKNEIRKRKKREFIYRHVSLVVNCAKQNQAYKGHKTIQGAELVQKARKELSYSDLTYNGDIFYGIIKEFKELEKEGNDLRSKNPDRDTSI